MSDRESIPPDIKRFILTSIDSVPHLEAVLMFRADAKSEWDAQRVAHSLYVSEKVAEQALSDLAQSGFIKKKPNTTAGYFYAPATPQLGELLDRLAEIYPKNIIEITRLIHSKINKQAQRFGDAFKWKNREE